MIDSPRSYKRRRRYSAVDISIIIGAAAGVVAAAAGVIAIIPGVSKADSATGSRPATPSSTASARSNFPRGKAVVIKKNSVFSLYPGQGVLLHRDRGEDAFALSELPSGRSRPGVIRVYFNGMRKDIALGETVVTSDSGCFVWIVSEASLIEEVTMSAVWRFEYHCNR